jgi:copper resistance protein C
MRRRLAVLSLGLVLGLAAMRPAFAHAVLVESSPAIGAQVQPGAIALRLRFNSRIDRTRSRLTLIHEDHSTAVLPIDRDGTDDLLLSNVTLGPGSYVVRWQVLALDGHITRGDVPITVRGAIAASAPGN